MQNQEFLFRSEIQSRESDFEAARSDFNANRRLILFYTPLLPIGLIGLWWQRNRWAQYKQECSNDIGLDGDSSLDSNPEELNPIEWMSKRCNRRKLLAPVERVLVNGASWLGVAEPVAGTIAVGLEAIELEQISKDIRQIQEKLDEVVGESTSSQTE